MRESILLDGIGQTATPARTYPGYLGLLETGELERRAELALERMACCTLCPRRCRVDRLASSRKSACRTGRRALVGVAAPGRILFAWSNLRTVFCRDWRATQRGRGRHVSANELASMMLDAQAQGHRTLALDNPSHVVGQILEALCIAARQGLRLPLVYASNGFDGPEGLELLDGVIDVYAPEMQYGDSREGRLYARVRNYASANRDAVREMHRQVGDLVLDVDGTPRRGLLVRHLVLPGGASGSARVFRFLAEEISPRTAIEVRDDHRPEYRATEFPPLDRPTTSAEVRRACALADKRGLRRTAHGGTG